MKRIKRFLKSPAATMIAFVLAVLQSEERERL